MVYRIDADGIGQIPLLATVRLYALIPDARPLGDGVVDERLPLVGFLRPVRGADLPPGRHGALDVLDQHVVFAVRRADRAVGGAFADPPPELPEGFPWTNLQHRSLTAALIAVLHVAPHGLAPALGEHHSIHHVAQRRRVWLQFAGEVVPPDPGIARVVRQPEHVPVGRGEDLADPPVEGEALRERYAGAADEAQRPVPGHIQAVVVARGGADDALGDPHRVGGQRRSRVVVHAVGQGQVPASTVQRAVRRQRQCAAQARKCTVHSIYPSSRMRCFAAGRRDCLRDWLLLHNCLCAVTITNPTACVKGKAR